MIRCTAGRLHPTFLLLVMGLITLLISCKKNEVITDNGLPRVMDDQLHLELIAEDPEIVTPIGLIFDATDHLYVLESHTHSPLSDYTGPQFDRIRRGTDENGDGIPESWQIFADSIVDGMNLACGPDNTIYLAAKDRVLAIKDQDQDGISDQTDTLFVLRTQADIYDHAGILGIAFSPDGWLFVSRGNIGGMAWEMEGPDGSRLDGYGDGGNLVRCRPDGSALEEVATGFWNPFGIQFSRQGRLLLTDNDPDSRGPNRLVEVVYGGDYGYKSIYGGSGIHPFLSWNGELPGTLPYAVALGEAPTGLIDATFSNFGDGYSGQILAGVWEENSIVRIPLRPRESSITGEPQVLIKGDSTFHPVAFAVNSQGELYFSDWVVRQYPNHGKGRIWRLSANNPQPPAKQTIAATPGASKGGKFLARYLSDGDREALMAALQAGDDFTRSAARKRFADPAYEQDLVRLLQDEDSELRMQALLTLFHSRLRPSSAALRNLLADETPGLRRMTLIYIALHARGDLYEDVVQSLYQGLISPDLFETYLATVRHLQPNFIDQYTHRSKRMAKQVELALPPNFLLSLIRDNDLAPEIRAAALPLLKNDPNTEAGLSDLLEQSAPPIQAALLEWYSQRPNAAAADKILQIARDPAATPDLRAQAILSLSYQNGNFCPEVADLLAENNAFFARVALRYLCRCAEDKDVQAQVNAFLPQAGVAGREIWSLCQGKVETGDRPATDQEWAKLIDGQGNAVQGRWVFHLRQAQCQSCHRINGWGGDFGPDLSHVGSSKSREQLLTAILEPSKEISPEWQGWYVTDKEGTTHYGRQIDVGFKNAELMLASGEFVTYKEPQRYGMAESSLMPEGLEAQLSVAELNDLVTYLMSLK